MSYDFKRLLRKQNQTKNLIYENKNRNLNDNWFDYNFPRITGNEETLHEIEYTFKVPKDAMRLFNNEKLKANLLEMNAYIKKQNKGRLVKKFGQAGYRKIYESISLFYLTTKNEALKETIDTIFNGMPAKTTENMLRRMNYNSNDLDLTMFALKVEKKYNHIKKNLKHKIQDKTKRGDKNENKQRKRTKSKRPKSKTTSRKSKKSA